MNKPIKLNKAEKITVTLFAIVALFFVVAPYIMADSRHHPKSTVISYLPASTTNTTVVNNQSVSGVATAIAAGQHQFSASTFDWQGSISTGSYSDSTAFSFALAKRFKATLISGSVANEGGKIGIGAAVGFKF